jgi:hypothetical protein
MALPTQITFRHMDASPALADEIRRRAEGLCRAIGRVVACRVVVEAPTNHHRKGGNFHVCVEIDADHGRTFAGGGRDDTHASPDAYLAVRQAFDCVRRRLMDAQHGHGRPNGRGSAAVLRDSLR